MEQPWFYLWGQNIEKKFEDSSRIKKYIKIQKINEYIKNKTNLYLETKYKIEKQNIEIIIS